MSKKPNSAAHCTNHPAKKALSFCHHCGDWFCSDCFEEGPEHYFCQKKACKRALVLERRSSCYACGKKVSGDPEFCAHCSMRLKPIRKDDKDDLVTIARFSTTMEAYLALTKLESAGIEAYVADEQMIALNPFYNIALGGVRLQVSRKKVVRARKTLTIRKSYFFERPEKMMFPIRLSIGLVRSMVFFVLYLFVVYLMVWLALKLVGS